MTTYRIVRFFQKDHPREIVEEGLSLSEAQEHCRDPETSSRTARSADAQLRTTVEGPWFEGYEEE